MTGFASIPSKNEAQLSSKACQIVPIAYRTVQQDLSKLTQYEWKPAFVNGIKRCINHLHFLYTLHLVCSRKNWVVRKPSSEGNEDFQVRKTWCCEFAYCANILDFFACFLAFSCRADLLLYQRRRDRARTCYFCTSCIPVLQKIQGNNRIICRRRWFQELLQRRSILVRLITYVCLGDLLDHRSPFAVSRVKPDRLSNLNHGKKLIFVSQQHVNKGYGGSKAKA